MISVVTDDQELAQDMAGEGCAESMIVIGTVAVLLVLVVTEIASRIGRRS